MHVPIYIYTYTHIRVLFNLFTPSFSRQILQLYCYCLHRSASHINVWRLTTGSLQVMERLDSCTVSVQFPFYIAHHHRLSEIVKINSWRRVVAKKLASLQRNAMEGILPQDSSIQVFSVTGVDTKLCCAGSEGHTSNLMQSPLCECKDFALMCVCLLYVPQTSFS